jgi:hypothetical protein
LRLAANSNRSEHEGEIGGYPGWKKGKLAPGAVTQRGGKSRPEQGGPACARPGPVTGKYACVAGIPDFQADAIYLEEIRAAGLYDQIWQAFAVLLPVRTVGVMGDGRSYDHVCALRAVTSSDGMTADFFPFDMGFLGRAATRIINEVKGINRVVYDVTSKPPGTIEWE